MDIRKLDRESGRYVRVVGFGLERLAALSRWTATPPGRVRQRRIDATEVDVATRLPGRLSEVLVNEGAMVTAGQIVARMDTDELHAQLREANARLFADEARGTLRRGDRKTTPERADLCAQRVRSLQPTEQRRSRSVERLDGSQRPDDRRSGTNRLPMCRCWRHRRQSKPLAQQWTESSRTPMTAYSVSPIDGRVLYRLAEPGEVLAAGRVVTVLDLTDVFMTIFLPTQQAGRVTVGDGRGSSSMPCLTTSFPPKVSFVDPQAVYAQGGRDPIGV